MTEKSSEARQNILKSARVNFLEKGFSGTSMSQIAKDAGVTKGLLFYYFNTKEELWQRVKDYILGEETIHQIKEIPLDRFENFIASILNLRFELYARNPDLVRMMIWQRCDSQKAHIEGTKALPANMWEKAFLDFQEKGEINQTINLMILTDLVYALSAMPFLENLSWVYEDDHRETYKHMVKEMILAFVKR